MGSPENTLRGRVAFFTISVISRWVGGKRFDDWLKELVIEGAWHQANPIGEPLVLAPEWLGTADRDITED